MTPRVSQKGGDLPPVVCRPVRGCGAQVAMPHAGELYSSALRLTRNRADAEDRV
jgi:hypothetical protein